ncbi:hypothetical protein [Brevibacterium casei]
MTIYDVPIDDTVFFPVSGDTMRLMKHEEEQKKNGTGNPAKSSPDAADPNHLQGERTVKHHDTAIVSPTPDTDCRCPDDRCTGYHHPAGEICWCTRVLDREVDKRAKSIRFIDGGQIDLGTYVRRDDSPQLRVLYRTVLDFNGTDLIVERDTPVDIFDRKLPGMEMPIPEEAKFIARTVAEAVVYGRLRKDRMFRFTADLTPEFEATASTIVHPTWCKDDGNCYVPCLGVNVEHASEVEKIQGGEFTAEVWVEAIVGTADHRDETDSSILPHVEITEAGAEPIWLTLFPADLRSLGQFLIEQADRLEPMIHEVEVHS